MIFRNRFVHYPYLVGIPVKVGDIQWHVLNKENWEKIDERELASQLCEGNINSLFECCDTQEMFDYLNENNCVVVDSAAGQLF